jgi:hypothetical protein
MSPVLAANVGDNSEAREDVYVVGQNRLLEHAHTGGFFRVSDGGLDVPYRGLVHTPHPPPGVPSDVGVQLVGMVSCH